MRKSSEFKKFDCSADNHIRSVAAVTFLLFVVSMAVLEYVMRRRPGNIKNESRMAIKKSQLDTLNPGDGTPGLAELSRAVEQEGRGAETGTPDRTEARTG
jgi:hypothetical protein